MGFPVARAVELIPEPWEPGLWDGLAGVVGMEVAEASCEVWMLLTKYSNTT
jgi:hypothetical protein